MPDLSILAIILPLLLRSNPITILLRLSHIKVRQQASAGFYVIFSLWALAPSQRLIRSGLVILKMSVQNFWCAELSMVLPIMEIPSEFRQLLAKCILINAIREIRLSMQWQSELSSMGRRSARRLRELAIP